MWKTTTIAYLLLILATGMALSVTLPDEAEQTYMSATICEQADIYVPDMIWFDATDVTVRTDISVSEVNISNISLAPGNALRLELKANSEETTPPEGGTVAWVAGDFSWLASTWIGGTGHAGTLSSTAYTVVAESEPNATQLYCGEMFWSMAARPECDRAGAHELWATWKISSFAP